MLPATWCLPCRIEMPALEDRYAALRAHGFTVLAVNAGEPEQAVRGYGQELGLSFPLLLDPVEVVQRLYRIRGYPSSLFIDRQGVVRVVHIGLWTGAQLGRALEEMGLGS